MSLEKKNQYLHLGKYFFRIKMNLSACLEITPEIDRTDNRHDLLHPRSRLPSENEKCQMPEKQLWLFRWMSVCASWACSTWCADCFCVHESTWGLDGPVFIPGMFSHSCVRLQSLWACVINSWEKCRSWRMNQIVQASLMSSSAPSPESSWRLQSLLQVGKEPLFPTSVGIGTCDLSVFLWTFIPSRRILIRKGSHRELDPDKEPVQPHDQPPLSDHASYP